MAVFEIIVVLYLGLVLGSFSTAVAYRTASGESWIFSKNKKLTRSRCPHCDHVLAIKDLIPIFSWLFQKGRCRYCGEPISSRYIILEIVSVLACFGLYVSWGFSWEMLLLIALVPFFLALISIDMEHLILPDSLVLICGVIAGLFVSLRYFSFSYDHSANEYLTTHLTAFILFPTLLWGLGKFVSIIKKRDALGFGDVKFFAVAGLLTGVQALPLLLILSGVFGVVSGIIYRLKGSATIFPMGPALITSVYIILVMQGFSVEMIDLY